MIRELCLILIQWTRNIDNLPQFLKKNNACSATIWSVYNPILTVFGQTFKHPIPIFFKHLNI